MKNKYYLLIVIILFLALTGCEMSNHTHEFISGTCTCGEIDPNYVEPHTHEYVEGKCNCGETDPNYVAPHNHEFVDGKCSCGAEEEKKYYMLSFDTDGGSIIETVLLYSGDTIIAPANRIKDGYTFKGWSPNLPDVMPESNVEVKAIWEPITFTVTFNAKGGTLVAGDENQNVLSFDDIDYPTYEYYG